MQRFTISLDDTLAIQFDKLIAAKGYENRSEAVRDLIRARLGSDLLKTPKTVSPGGKNAVAWCVANVSYVYNHHEQAVAARVLDLQHEHHDLVVTSLHTHLDHDNCLETVVLKGPLKAVQACAEQIVAMRGVRHGNVHLVALDADEHKPHSHSGLPPHSHLRPVN